MRGSKFRLGVIKRQDFVVMSDMVKSILEG